MTGTLNPEWPQGNQENQAATSWKRACLVSGRAGAVLADLSLGVKQVILRHAEDVNIPVA